MEIGFPYRNLVFKGDCPFCYLTSFTSQDAPGNSLARQKNSYCPRRIAFVSLGHPSPSQYVKFDQDSAADEEFVIAAEQEPAKFLDDLKRQLTKDHLNS